MMRNLMLMLLLTIFANIAQAGLFMIHSNLSNFQPITSPEGVQNITAIAIDPFTRKLYIGTPHGKVYRGTHNDGGWIWQKADDGISPEVGIQQLMVVTHPDLQSTIYARYVLSPTREQKQESGIYVSHTNGVNWREFSNKLKTKRINQIAALPNYRGQVPLLAVGTNEGVYFSQDDTEHWELSNDGFQEGDKTIISLVTDVENNGYFFAGTAQGRLYYINKHDSNNTRWRLIDYPESNEKINSPISVIVPFINKIRHNATIYFVNIQGRNPPTTDLTIVTTHDINSLTPNFKKEVCMDGDLLDGQGVTQGIACFPGDIKDGDNNKTIFFTTLGHGIYMLKDKSDFTTRDCKVKRKNAEQSDINYINVAAYFKDAMGKLYIGTQ